MLAGMQVSNKQLVHARPHRGLTILVAVLFTAALVAGCASRSSRAPIDDRSRVSAEPSQEASGTYVVRPGDTLYKIATQHGMEVARLQQLNNITDPSQLSIGQVLRLDSQTSLAATADGQAATPQPVSVDSRSSSKTPISTSAARAADANLIPWGWPASGKIIQGFDSNTKGIDIEGSIGDPVVAAADGKVMYAGNGVRGLGNLILLGHSDGFITAYAHNQELLVKTGANVKKGSRIATVGQSDTTSPRLHFEIRRRGTPVNPLSYLPAQ